VIRVAVLDDHPTVLAGLRRLLEGTDDLKAVAAAATPDQLLAALNTKRADVAVLDYDLARGDGLGVCQRLKERINAPGVIIYSAFAGPALALAAHIAGADALVDKRAAVGELLTAVRRVADGDSAAPEVPLEIREILLSRLDPDELPVASMLLAGTSHQDIAETLDIDQADVLQRIRCIVARVAPKLSRHDAWPPGHKISG
jgi:DNA-binding NarL/FixJ family response regulator